MTRSYIIDSSGSGLFNGLIQLVDIGILRKYGWYEIVGSGLRLEK